MLTLLTEIYLPNEGPRCSGSLKRLPIHLFSAARKEDTAHKFSTMAHLRHLRHLHLLTRASSRPALHFNRPASQSDSSSLTPPTSIPLPSRWLSDLKLRIGKCILFGLKADQLDEAGGILRIVTTDWRELLAGSEGFLVGKRRAGLEGQEVVWGEMVGVEVESHRSTYDELSSTVDG